MQIYGNAATWWTSGITLAFLDHFFGDRSELDPTTVLLLDDFSGHWTSDVVARAKALLVRLAKVPPRFTCVCQPADIA